MKKSLITVVFLTVFGFYGQAQNTSLDGFLKSNWGQSMAEVKANNSAKGYKYSVEFGSTLLATDANFAGASNCMIIWSFTSDKLYEGIVIITPYLTAKAMSDYDSMKAKISVKYGEGMTYESYDYPYVVGDGYWETAFKLGKGHLSSVWNFEDGNSISMELINNDDLTTKIKYQSTELVAENIKQRDAANYADL